MTTLSRRINDPAKVSEKARRDMEERLRESRRRLRELSAHSERSREEERRMIARTLCGQPSIGPTAVVLQSTARMRQAISAGPGKSLSGLSMLLR